jgi:hypothetical protein
MVVEERNGKVELLMTVLSEEIVSETDDDTQ